MLRKICDFLCVVLFLFTGLFCLFRAPLAAQLVQKVLPLCTKLLIPSLFPFLFLTQLTVRTGLAEKAGSAVSWLLSPVFGVPQELCGAFLAGLFGGFPNGATAAGLAYQNGRCSKSDAERVVALADNASPAFLIGAAGAVSLGNLKGGFLLCGALLMTVITNALLLRFAYPIKKAERVRQEISHTSLSSAICDSVRDAVAGMTAICGYVVLFSVLCGLLENLLLSNANALQRFMLQSLWELSGAVSLLPHADFPLNYLLCAAACGFSGLCVIWQVTDVCNRYRLSAKPFVFTRVTSVVLFPAFTAILLRFLPRESVDVFFAIASPQTADSRQLLCVISVYAFICFASMAGLAGLWLLISLRENIKNRKIPQKRGKI